LKLAAATQAGGRRVNPQRVVDALATAGFDYVLLCRVAADQPFPDTPFPVVAQAGRFRLLRLMQER
jgi:hypothetical protein